MDSVHLFFRQFPGLMLNISAGLLSGTVNIIYTLSMVLLVFGSNVAFLNGGLTIALLSAGIVSIILAKNSDFKNTVAMSQDTSTVIFLLFVGVIISKISLSGSAVNPFSTVFAAITLSGILVGIFLYVLGNYHLGNTIFFIPYTVIGGFLAGTGYFFVDGAWLILLDHSFAIDKIPTYFLFNQIIKWLPGLVLGIILFLLNRFFKKPLLTYMTFFLVITLFFTVLFITDISLAEAKQMGLLLPGINALSPIELFRQVNVRDIDWIVLSQEAWYVLPLGILTAVGLLVNIKTIDLMDKKNIDFNHELKTTGIANILSSLSGGGFISYHSLSISMINKKMGAYSSVVGIVAGSLCLLVLLFGMNFIDYLPRFPFAGILLFIGLELLVEWLYTSWFVFALWDNLIIVFIFFMIIFYGFLPGIIVGVIAAAVKFVVHYGAINTIKRVSSGVARRSNVDRDDLSLSILTTHGEAICIIELQGYLFFGNSYALITAIQSRLDNKALLPLNYLLIDFKQVSGIDVSTVSNVEKLMTISESFHLKLLFVGVNQRIKKLFNQHVSDQTAIAYVVTLDYALEMCEEQILLNELNTPILNTSFKQLIAPCLHQSSDINELINELELLMVPAGYQLLTQGQIAEELFFIEKGIVEAYIIDKTDNKIRLRTMKMGTVAGETGLYLNSIRSANIVTKTPCTLYKLTQERLRFLEKNKPGIAVALHRFIACEVMLRLQHSNELLQILLE